MAARGIAAAALAAASLLAPAAPDQKPAAHFEPYPDAEVQAIRNPHLYKGKPLCQACHVKDDGLVMDPVALCKRCHHFGHANHPVDVVVKGEVDLPLWDGKVVCHTCHDPHDLRRNKAGLRKQADAMCLDCHKGH